MPNNKQRWWWLVVELMKVKKLVQSIEEAGKEAIFVQADVTKEADVR
jgi:hypothetical protein